MRLIVGLGNPGKKYERTRHNVGFQVIDQMAQMLSIDVSKKKFGALTGQGSFENENLILAKPQQYMNLSGQVVAVITGFFKLNTDDLIIVTDDMALDVGTIRIRPKGSAGGHNGLKDIIEKLGTQDFARLRIGVGQSTLPDSADYVLAKPTADEQKMLDNAKDQAVKALICWIKEDIENTMSRYNKKNSQ
jgi:PTH1 family peptidyl-tRNA hydrolase